MGREARTWAQAGGEAGHVRALLESTELILRVDVRRKFPRGKLARVRVEGGLLLFGCCGEAIALQLGAAVAHRWAEAIATPAPSLRAKLGLAAGARAVRVCAFEDAMLESALAGVLVDAVKSADDHRLHFCAGGPKVALAVHSLNPALPVWVVHPKGKGVAFGDGEIRTVLRARGFRDTKSCAVSDQLTASRYAVPLR